MAARIDVPDLVRSEYLDESRLEVRFRPFRDWHEAPTPEQRVLDWLVARHPREVLEVGCGWGGFSQQLVAASDARVISIDLSPRMVQLAAARGLPAMVADVQELPFDAQSFDVVVANWMLYHVPDVDRALAEIRRVLRPGGMLIAVTMGDGMLRELWDQVADDGSTPELSFGGDNGAEVLARHFDIVERHDLPGTAVFPSRDDAIAYMESTLTRGHLATTLPAWDGPLRATTTNVAFVAYR